MGLIHGHYLSDRRASTQERLFKYADKGYGIRILPSYISALAARASNRSKGKARLNLDLQSIAAEQRNWTTRRAAAVRIRRLQDLMPPRIGYGASRCLKGFRIFMRCVALWELAHRGTISLKSSIWASNDYHDAMTTYDDTPNPPYKWDKDFDVLSFEQTLYKANAVEISNWVLTDRKAGWCRTVSRSASTVASSKNTSARCKTPRPSNLIPKYRRPGTGNEEEDLMEKDLILQVLLPCKFAVYANDVVSRAQAQVGLPQTQLLTPVASDFNPLKDTERAEGLFIWRIGKELMWQQLDRGVDEVLEMLYAFRRVNEQLRDIHTQESRFRAELARREVYDELDAFARWVEDKSLVTVDIPLRFEDLMDDIPLHFEDLMDLMMSSSGDGYF
ncbi:hypothetical protein B0H14DRAFT_3159029 [Mycena olivaceomarginata]|nr:hypothetical protein B0H14DRAFT_3159029 [Mycena olivaceomarginata]